METNNEQGLIDNKLIDVDDETSGKTEDTEEKTEETTEKKPKRWEHFTARPETFEFGRMLKEDNHFKSDDSFLKEAFRAYQEKLEQRK